MSKMASREKESERFSVGGWLFHPYHGVGQITNIDTKTLRGEEKEYYRVETDESILWIPLERAEESPSRPLVSPERLRDALGLLRKAPRKMASHYKSRRNTIEKVRSKGALKGIVRIIRDLTARRRNKSLNTTEQKAIRHFRKGLIDEWCVVEGISEKEARSELRKLLRKTPRDPISEASEIGPLGKEVEEG
jgi:CarD family transcriptional regulator